MNFCTQCGAELQPGQSFCTKCGAKNVAAGTVELNEDGTLGQPGQAANGGYSDPYQPSSEVYEPVSNPYQSAGNAYPPADNAYQSAPPQFNDYGYNAGGYPDVPYDPQPEKKKGGLMGPIIGIIVAAIAAIAIILIVTFNPFGFGTDANTSTNTTTNTNTSGTTTNTTTNTTTDAASTTFENPFVNAKKGDIITFGTYGGEDVQWRVLEVSGDTATVITDKVVESQSFGTSYSATTWESSALRSWMNGTFYNSFTDDQKKIIVKTDVTNNANSKTGTSSGSATQDYVYALSAAEAEKYFSSDSERLAYATTHAKSDGVDVVSQSGCTPWWLRTSGNKSNDATYVWGRTGAVDYNGYGVDESTYGARPVMHVSTKAVS